MVKLWMGWDRIGQDRTGLDYPAWKPQAIFAWSIMGMSSSSGPHLKLPYPSPRSTLMKTLRFGGAMILFFLAML